MLDYLYAVGRILTFDYSFLNRRMILDNILDMGGAILVGSIMTVVLFVVIWGAVEAVTLFMRSLSDPPYK